MNGEDAACAIARARVAAQGGFQVSIIASCEFIQAAGSPGGYYVFALRSRRRCAYICSNLMGWFAVDRRSGRLFEWDVPEDRLGPEVKPR